MLFNTCSRTLGCAAPKVAGPAVSYNKSVLYMIHMLLACCHSLLHPAVSCMLEYVELCAEGPNPQALHETMSNLIQHLSSPC
jgi:hypothetical protein